MAPKRESPNFRHVIAPEEKEMRIPAGLNFNTLVSALVLSVVLWVGKATYDHSSTLTKIETQLPYVTASVTELKTQMSQLVTRGELESLKSDVSAKNSVMEAKGEVLNKRIMMLEFEKKKPGEPCADD